MDEFLMNLLGGDNQEPKENEEKEVQESAKNIDAGSAEIPTHLPADEPDDIVTAVQTEPVEEEIPSFEKPSFVAPDPDYVQNQKAYTEPKPVAEQNFYANTSNITGTYHMPQQNAYGAVPPPNYVPYQPMHNMPVAPQDTVQADKKRKKKNKLIITLIIVSCICLFLALLGIAAGFATYKEKVKDNPFFDQFSGLYDEEAQNTEDDDKFEGDNDAAVNIEDGKDVAKTDSQGNLTVAGVADKTIDSCVLISVYSNQIDYGYFSSSGGETSKLSGEGSGVIMSSSKGTTYIITCAHVISGGDNFKVTLNDGTELDATMVGADEQTDIGVLAVKKTGLKTAIFNSGQVQLGEQCVAIGCPGGSMFTNSVTSGYVSALARPVSSSIGYNTECIQTDAAINPGNSGGALFNMQGQVIGINSSKIASTEYEGMGFAIPSKTAIKIATSLIKNGYVEGRAKIGIQFTELSRYSTANSVIATLERKGFKDVEGAIVIDSVDKSSDLYNKDVKQYDLVVAVDGKELSSVDVLTAYLSKKSPGDKIKLTLARIEGNDLKIFEIECKLIEGK